MVGRLSGEVPGESAAPISWSGRHIKIVWEPDFFRAASEQVVRIHIIRGLRIRTIEISARLLLRNDPEPNIAFVCRHFGADGTPLSKRETNELREGLRFWAALFRDLFRSPCSTPPQQKPGWRPKQR